MPNFSNKDTLSIRKRPLRSAIKKRNKELQHLSKVPSLFKNVLSAQLSSIDFSTLTKFIILYNKKSLQKSLCTQQKKLSSPKRDCNLPILTANKTINNLKQYKLSQEESDLVKLKQVYTVQSNQIKCENPKSSLPLKRFIVRFLKTLNPSKPKVR